MREVVEESEKGSAKALGVFVVALEVGDMLRGVCRERLFVTRQQR